MSIATTTDVQFLADLTKATIDSARVYPDQETVGVHEGKPIPVKNILGFTAIRPAGLKAYPAIWVQDFTMGYSSGFVSVEEGLGPSATDRLAAELRRRTALAQRRDHPRPRHPRPHQSRRHAGLLSGHVFFRARSGRRAVGRLSAAEQLLRFHLAGLSALERHVRRGNLSEKRSTDGRCWIG